MLGAQTMSDDLLHTLLGNADDYMARITEEEQRQRADSEQRQRVEKERLQRSIAHVQQQRTEQEQRQRANQQRQLDAERQRLIAQQRQVADYLRWMPAQPTTEKPPSSVMGAGTPTTRPLRPVSSQQRLREALQRDYEFGTLLLAEFATLVLWLIFWLANGFFTALFVHAWALRLVDGLNGFLAQSVGVDFSLTLSSSTAWGLGACLHLMISLIELHLWRSGRRSTYLTIIAVGIFDVFTSAWGISALAKAWGLPGTGLAWIVLYVLLAEAIALFPERRMVDHGMALWIMLQRQPERSKG